MTDIIRRAGLTVEVKVARPRWDANDHPRDRQGRFIEIGALVKLFGGGGMGEVTANLGGNRIRVRRSDGTEVTVLRTQITVQSRPDGSEPTDRRADNPAPATPTESGPRVERGVDLTRGDVIQVRGRELTVLAVGSDQVGPTLQVRDALGADRTMRVIPEDAAYAVIRTDAVPSPAAVAPPERLDVTEQVPVADIEVGDVLLINGRSAVVQDVNRSRTPVVMMLSGEGGVPVRERVIGDARYARVRRDAGSVQSDQDLSFPAPPQAVDASDRVLTTLHAAAESGGDTEAAAVLQQLIADRGSGAGQPTVSVWKRAATALGRNVHDLYTAYMGTDLTGLFTHAVGALSAPDRPTAPDGYVPGEVPPLTGPDVAARFVIDRADGVPDTRGRVADLLRPGRSATIAQRQAVLRDRNGDRVLGMVDVLSPAARGQQWDPKRARSAARRFLASDPTLPGNVRMGQRVTLDSPDGLPGEGGVITRPVTGQVVRPPTYSYDGRTRIVIDGGDGVLVAQDVDNDGMVTSADEPNQRPPTSDNVTLDAVRGADLAVGDVIVQAGSVVEVTSVAAETRRTTKIGVQDVETGATRRVTADNTLVYPRIRVPSGAAPATVRDDDTAPGFADDPGLAAVPLLAGRLTVGDEVWAGTRLATVQSVERMDGQTVELTVRWNDNGRVQIDRVGINAEYQRRADDLPQSTPLPDDAATTRPVLYTYQRKAVVALGLDRNPDDLVAEAARRVRERRPLTAEQAQSLAAFLTGLSGTADVGVRRRRSLRRAAAAFGAAFGDLSTTGTRPDRAVSQETGGSITEGDHVAVADPITGDLLAGVITDRKPIMQGRLYQVTLFDAAADQHHTVLIARRQPVYRLPDVAPPQPSAPVPPSRTGPIREHVFAEDLRSGDVLTTFSLMQGDVAGYADGVRFVRLLPTRVGAGQQIEVLDRLGRSQTAFSGGTGALPSFIRTARGPESQAQPYRIVLPDDNDRQGRVENVEVGQRVTLRLYGNRETGTVVSAAPVDTSTADDPRRALRVELDSGYALDMNVWAQAPVVIHSEPDESVAAALAAERVRAKRVLQRRGVSDVIDSIRRNRISTLQPYRDVDEFTRNVERRYGDPAQGRVASEVNTLLRELFDDPGARADASRAAVLSVYNQILARDRDNLMGAAADFQELVDDGAADPDQAEEYLDQFMLAFDDRLPSTVDVESVAAALVAGLDVPDVGRVQPPATRPAPPIGSLPDRVAAYKAALPADSNVGRELTQVRAYRDLDLQALEDGQVPALETVSTYVDSVAADDGPGESAMAHLDVVMAAGRDMQRELSTDPEQRKRVADIQSAQREGEVLKFRHAAAWKTMEKATIRERNKAAKAAGYDNYELMKSLLPPESNDHGKLAQLHDQVSRATRAEQKETADRYYEWKSVNDRVLALSRQIAVFRREQAIKLLARVRDMGGTVNYVEHEDTTARPDRQLISKAMAGTGQSFPSEWVARLNNMPVQMTVRSGVRRGSYVAFSNDVSLSLDGEDRLINPQDPYLRVAVHEVGHAVQRAVPGLQQMEKAYLWSRTSKGDIGARTRTRMMEVAGAYGDGDEKGYPDKFPSRYTGKVYGERAGEVFTTGIESLMAGSPYLDADFEAWLLGVLALL